MKPLDIANILDEMPPISIDSRKVKAGDLFVALKGENHDGHDFIAEAIAKGANTIMAERLPPECQDKNIHFIEVLDTTHALGELAKRWREQFSLPIVGLTGSCGKTTVKGMIECLCKAKGKTLATMGNLNNHIGLPLMLLRLDKTYDYAVIEMGANHVGEIKYLAEIAKPNISLITNVHAAHLEGFGSIENVAKAKGEIYEALQSDGIAVLNLEEPLCSSWQATIDKRECITFGLTDKAMVYAKDIQYEPFSVAFTVVLPNQEIATLKINIPGKHTVMNALAAIAVGHALDLPLGTMTSALSHFEGVVGRLRRLQGLQASCVIDDTYNANPGSVQVALDVLAACPGEKIFVMGNMGELGPKAESLHAHIGEYAREKGVSHLLAVGDLTTHTVEAFGSGGKWYPNKGDLIQDLQGIMNANATILIKGSRSARMEEITQALTVKRET